MIKIKLLTIYFVLLHLLLLIIFLNSGFKDQLLLIKGKEKKRPSEITHHFDRMFTYHFRMDRNVPDGAVIFIGDSLTQGLCVSAITCPSVNYGIGEDTTVGVLRRLPYYNNSLRRSNAVVLAIGINDMKYRTNKEILVNYEKIVEKIPLNVPIIFSALLPIDEKYRDNWQGRSLNRINELNLNIKKMCKASDRLFFVDVGGALVDQEGNLADHFWSIDGVHLNSKGNAVWIKALKKTIREVQMDALDAYSSRR